MQHLYRTAEDLQAEHPVCANADPACTHRPEHRHRVGAVA